MSNELISHVMIRFPPPIADSVGGLASAESLHELRDRIVECFRAIVRIHAACALATVLRRGMGGYRAYPHLLSLLRQAQSRPLTDGQWVAVGRHCYEYLDGSHGDRRHPVSLFSPKSRAYRLIEKLLSMRKSETVAHGPALDDTQLEQLLRRRVPQLERLLEEACTVWDCFTLAHIGDDGRRFEQLMGYTPATGRWRRRELGRGRRLQRGRVFLFDDEWAVQVELSPILCFAGARLARELVVWDHTQARGRWLALATMESRSVPDEYDSELRSLLVEARGSRLDYSNTFLAENSRQPESLRARQQRFRRRRGRTIVIALLAGTCLGVMLAKLGSETTGSSRSGLPDATGRDATRFPAVALPLVPDRYLHCRIDSNTRAQPKI